MSRILVRERGGHINAVKELNHACVQEFSALGLSISIETKSQLPLHVLALQFLFRDLFAHLLLRY